MVDKHFLKRFNAIANKSELVAKSLPVGTYLRVALVVNTYESLEAACQRLGFSLDVPYTHAEIINVNSPDLASITKGVARLLVVAEKSIYDTFTGPAEQEFGYSMSLSLKTSAKILGCSAGELFFLA